MHRRVFALICLIGSLVIGAYSGRVWAQGTSCNANALCNVNWDGDPVGRFIKHKCVSATCLSGQGATALCLHEQCGPCGVYTGAQVSQCPTSPTACNDPGTPYVCQNWGGC
jgi:hypothetical protein